MGGKAHTPEIEMLQASLNPPFMSPESPGTAPGEGCRQGWPWPGCPGKAPLPQGSREWPVCAAAAACCKKQPAPAWILALFIPQQQPWPHWALQSHRLCPPLPLPPSLPPSLPGTHRLQLVARALEHRSHDALLASVFTALCEDSSWGARLVPLPVLREARDAGVRWPRRHPGNGGAWERGGDLCLLSEHLSLDGKFPLLWRHQF